MNSIEQIKQEISNLQKKVAELEKQPEELTRETGLPKLNKDCFWITAEGTIGEYSGKRKSEYDKLNSFNTIKEAQAERDYTLASRRVRSWAKAVNGEWKADWTTENFKKWGVIIAGTDCDENGVYLIGLVVDYFTTDNSFIHQICFPTEELAEKFLELFLPELEILAKP